MKSFRKLPFWERFSNERPGLNALFQPNVSTHMPYDEFDNDSDYNVVITPVPDYDTKSSKSSKNVSNICTMKGRSKNARESTRYFYESDENTHKRSKQKRDHKRTPKRHHNNHSPQQDENYSGDSDSSFSSTSSCNTADYRDERAIQKTHKEKRSRRRHGSDEKQERGSGTRSLKKRERDFESHSVCKRKDEREIPFVRKQEIVTTRRKGTAKCRSDTGHNRGRQDSGWDSYASDSSSERLQARSLKHRKQTKPKKGKKMSVSDIDVGDNWTIRHQTAKPSDGVMLKITMDDLRNVITENVLSAVKQGMDDDHGKQHVQRMSPEVLTTDTETLNSGFSAGSNNSTDALLPLTSGRRMSSAFQPVPQRQSGMLRRFIPILSSGSSDNTGQSRNSSVATIKSLLSGTSDPSDMASGSISNGYGGSVGPATAHYDRLEDKLMTQTNNLRGRHLRDATVSYDDNLTQEAIHHNLSAKQGKYSYFHDGQPNVDILSPRLSMDLTGELVKGFSGLHDWNGRRISATMNSSRRKSFGSDPDIQNPIQRQGSIDPDFGSALPTRIDRMPSGEPNMCMDAGPVPTYDTFAPNPEYLARRRQSLPVNLTSYPYSDLSFIEMEAILAATKAKMQTSTKEKLAIEKSLSTVPEESVDDSIEDKPIKVPDTADAPPQKTITKTPTEILKTMKETAKEKKKAKVTKALALLSSILVVLAGIGVLGLGILNMMDAEGQMYVAVTKKGSNDNSFQFYCYILCFIGGAVVVVCVCGCMGALKINTCLLKMFMVSLVVLLAVQGIMVTMVMVSQKDMPSIPLLAAVVDGVKDVVLDHLKASLRDSYIADSLVARAWDQLQVQMECCGCQSQDDYKYSTWKNATTDSKIKMPDSCCVVPVKDIDDIKPTNKFLCQSMTPGFWHDTGCHDILMMWYKQNSVMAFGATMGLAGLEILSLLCTVRLYRSLTQKKKTRENNI